MPGQPSVLPPKASGRSSLRRFISLSVTWPLIKYPPILAVRGAKQFNINCDEIRIEEPSDGKHETHGKGCNFNIFFRCDRAFAKKDTMETELTFAFAKFQKKYENVPILD